MVVNKYLAGLLSVAITLLTAFVAIPAGSLDAVSIGQLISIGVGAIGTFIVPVLSGGWQAGFKVGVAIAAAAVSAVIPFVANGGITAVQVGIVALAALNALAVQIGVNVRVDSEKAKHEALT